MIYLIALMPIGLLLILSLTAGVKAAVWGTSILTSLLFFYWGAEWSHYVGALATSALTTVNILMIVFGATFLYNIMSDTGLIAGIGRSLDGLGPNAEIRFFLVAFGMTAFFEGVAGFGTPGAIVPLILVTMGYGALRSVSTVLLFDGLFSAFGAVGTPLSNGLELPLQLGGEALRQISVWAAIVLSLAGVLAVVLLFYPSKKADGRMGGNIRTILKLYLFFAVPFVLSAWFVPELATVLAALSMLGLSVLFLKQDGFAVNLRAWIPYVLLALVLLLPKVFPWLREALDVEIGFTDILHTGVSSFFQPLLSPFFPFVLVGIAVAYFKKSATWGVKSSLMKVGQVSLVLYPSIIIAQLMILSGVVQPSMVEYIADLKGRLGVSYPFFSPFIGMLGTFITGSTTLSNMVFGPSQLATAEMLSMNGDAILSLQLVGASIGNAICLFNIIAAATIAGITNFSGILSDNLKPTLILGVFVGIIGMLLVHVL